MQDGAHVSVHDGAAPTTAPSEEITTKVGLMKLCLSDSPKLSHGNRRAKSVKAHSNDLDRALGGLLFRLLGVEISTFCNPYPSSINSIGGTCAVHLCHGHVDGSSTYPGRIVPDLPKYVDDTVISY